VASGDRVLDAGTGTGVLAAYLGRMGADVVTYERDPEFAEVARENVRLAGVADRVEVRTGDLTDALETRERPTDDGTTAADDAATAADDVGADGASALSAFDVLTLDTEDAPAVVARAPDLLVPGGYVAVYSPFVENSKAAVEAARGAGLSAVETIETIQREMDFGDRGSRPSTAGVGHTGYLTFARNE
jgi:tRNA (adenine57-N1/adenine58-N1)-methyltransferase